MLRELQRRGGVVADSDAFVDLWSGELAEARKRGLVNDGGGWGVGYRLTTKAEKLLRLRSPTA